MLTQTRMSLPTVCLCLCIAACTQCIRAKLYPAEIDLGQPEVSITNKTLKVVAGDFPPSTVFKRSENGTIIGYEGLLFHYLEWMSQFYKFKYEIIEIEDNIKGRLIEGEWTGMMQQLTDGEVDIALTRFGVTARRANNMELGGYVGGDHMAILVNYPKPVTSYYGVIEPFKLDVWLCVFGMWIYAFAFVWLVVKIRWRYFPEKRYLAHHIRTFPDTVMYLLISFFSQGVYHSRGHRSMGILTATSWCFATFVIVNVYTSTLTTFMSLRYQRPAINSFRDIAFSDAHDVLVGKGTISQIEMLRADKGVYKKIGDKLRACPSCIKEDWNNIAKGVLENLDTEDEGRLVGMGMKTVLEEMIQNDFLATGRCRLTLAKEQLMWKPMFIGLPLRSPYFGEISHGSLWWHDMGLHSYWKQKEANPKQCLLKYNQKGNVRIMNISALKLNQVMVAFVVLGIGLSLAMLAFIYERLHHIWNR